MRISQVEEQVGITRRNIRFYEKEGLLSPGRDSENGYREYSEAEVEELRKIKLLRKLDLPLEEIRRMQRGELTLGDAMKRHIVVLERQQSNLGAMKKLCAALAGSGEQFSTLDSARHLAEMELLEQGGTNFVNIGKKDTRGRYVGSLVGAGIFALLMAGVIALLLWAYWMDPAEAPPLPVLAVLIAIPAAAILGVLVALVQRFKQIRGGEEDAASQY